MKTYKVQGYASVIKPFERVVTARDAGEARYKTVTLVQAEGPYDDVVIESATETVSVEPL
jgi:hypothetical protein